MPSMKGFSPAVKKELGGVESSVGKASDKAGSGIGSRMASSITGALGKAVKVGAIGAGVAAGAALVGGFKSAVSQQNAEKTLTGLYGSAKKAEDTMAGLAKVSAKSPIDYDAYTKAAQSLAYAGVEGKRATGILKNVGLAITAAGGSSENMGSATDAILKMVNAGKVQLDTLQQLSDAGVPILSGLSKHYGKSMAEVNKMASAGQIKLDDVLSVMQNATGKTFQQMKAAGQQASQSFGNQWKIAKDNINRAIGKAMLPLLERIAPMLGKIGQAAPKVINKLAGSFGQISSKLGAMFAKIDWGAVFAGARTKLSSAVNALQPVFDAMRGFFGDVVESAKIVAPAIGNIVDALKPMAAWIAKMAFGALIAALKVLGPLLKVAAKAFAELAKHKTLVQILGGLALGILGVVKAVKLYRLAAGGVTKGIGKLRDGIETVKKGFATTKRVVGDAKAGIQLYGEAAKNGIGKAAGAIRDYSRAAASGVATGARWMGQQAKRLALLAKEGILWTVNRAKVLAYSAAQKVAAAATKVWAAVQRVLNMVMRANPIGLIITGLTLLVAALVWFFTKTKLGKKIIAAAWAGIKKAIKAVADWFTKKVWPALKKVISALGRAFKAAGRVITAAWVAIRKGISTAWKNYIRPALQAMWRFIQKVLVPIIKFLWSKVVRPVFKAIAAAVKRYISGVVVPVLKAMWKFVKNVLIPVLRFLWTRVVKPVFRGIGSTISSVWKNVIKPVFEGMKRFVTKTLPSAFRAGRDGIKRIWTGLQNIVKKPVNYIIGTIYNKGIRRLFNALPLPDKWKLPELHKFAKGGSVTGGQKGKDSVPALMMPGEHVLTAKEVRKLGGQAAVYRMRELINSGGLTAKQLVKDQPTTSSSGKRKGDIGWPAKDENVPGFAKGGGLTQVQIDRAMRFARKQVGKPYIWGGVGPAGYDCSGMMSAVTNVLAGRSPYSRIGTSSTFPWGGFKPGWGEWTVGAFTGSPGHVAGTLTGTNIESTNGSVRMGSAARGAGDSMFTRRAHLGAAGDLFAAMGAGPGAGGMRLADVKYGGATTSSWKDALTAIPKFIKNIRGWMKEFGNSKIWQMFKDALFNAGGKTVQWFNDKIPDKMGPIPVPDNPIPNPFGTGKMKNDYWGDLSRTIGAGIAGAKAAGGAKKYAQALLKQYGWAGQWSALDSLWTKESGWNPNADNPSSTAYGIPQMLTGVHSLPADYKTNAKTQVRVGLNYIRQRYGSPARAWAHSQSTGWYGNGMTGGLFTKPTTIGVGENGPERVDITPLASGLGRKSLRRTTQAAGYARGPVATTATGNGGDNTRNRAGRRYAIEITNWDEGTGYMAEIAQEEIAEDNDLNRQILRANR